MTTKVAVDFSDAAALVRWRTQKAELYDALTLEVERADALAEHLTERLDDLSEGEPRELYALSLVAESVRKRLGLIVERAKALRDLGGDA